jgi:hypothetical protein
LRYSARFLCGPLCERSRTGAIGAEIEGDQVYLNDPAKKGGPRIELLSGFRSAMSIEG